MSRARPSRLWTAAVWTLATLAVGVFLAAMFWATVWLLVHGWSVPAVATISGCSALFGYRVGDRTAEIRRITVQRMAHRVDAWVKADTATDLDVVGPATPAPGTRVINEPGDGEAVEPWINEPYLAKRARRRAQ